MVEGATAVRQRSGDAHRCLDVLLPIDPAHAGEVADPARLGEWLVSRAEVDGSSVRLVVEEEYGYRRTLEGELRAAHPGLGFELRVDRANREWDGCDGTPVGPSTPAQRWDEPALVGTALRVDVVDEVPRVRWTGFPADAIDATRREGTLLRWGVERAIAAWGSNPTTGLSEVARPSPGAVDLVLGAPGACWSVGDATGTVLVAVAGRRLATSWRSPRVQLPTGLLDVRILRRPGSEDALHATLRSVVPSSDANRWLEAFVDDLVDSATSARAGA